MRLIELEAEFFRIKVKREIGRFLKPGVDPFKFQKPDFTGWADDDLEEREHDQEYLVAVETLAEADGVRFLNPAQWEKNGGPVGTGGVHVYFEGKALFGDHNKIDGQYVRWHATGSSLEDLSTTPSILIHGSQPGANDYWHGYITKGEIVTV